MCKCLLRLLKKWEIQITKKILFLPLDLSNRDNEIQKLNNDIVHVKDILQRQAVEKDQMSQQLSSLQNNEETKIEIKNLQNALDSSKKELESQRMLVNEYKMKIEDLSKQVMESKLLTQKSGGDSFLVSHHAFIQ